MCFFCYAEACGPAPGREEAVDSDGYCTTADVNWAPPTDEIRSLAAAVQTFYEHEPAGGPLHVQLDDANTDDHMWPTSREQMVDDVFDAATIDAAWDIAQRMRSLTNREHNTVLAVAHGSLVLT